MAAAGRIPACDRPVRADVPVRNNFDLLRFALAASVVLYHARILSAAPALDFLRVFSAELAVKAFFVVSGFLVYMSFEKSGSTIEYFGKRIRRIYPAYVTVVIAAAALGAFITELSLREYFSAGVLRYLAANLAFANFLAPTLPGVFAHNPLTEVNGALWTIKIEVMFYATLPVLAWLGGRFGQFAVLVCAYALAIAWSLGFASLAGQTGSDFYTRLSYQFPGQLGYFSSGALAYCYLPLLQRHWTLAAMLGVAGVVVGRTFAASQPFLEPAALTLIVAWLALGVRHLGNLTRFGDLSYGIYIIHFPVLQTMVASGAFTLNPFAALATAIVLVLALAFACWHLVEKPFLRRSSHYVVASRWA